MKSNEIVKEWVNKRRAFYFFLPDGPYGRPFDSQYLIEKIEEASDGFKIFLSDDLMIHFIGNTTIEEAGCNLLIKNFNYCIFENNEHKTKKYNQGEVVLSGF